MKTSNFIIAAIFGMLLVSNSTQAQIGDSQQYLRTKWLNETVKDTTEWLTTEAYYLGELMTITYNFDSIIPPAGTRKKSFRVCSSYMIVPMTIKQFTEINDNFFTLSVLDRDPYCSKYLVDKRTDGNLIIEKWVLPTSKRMAFVYSKVE